MENPIGQYSFKEKLLVITGEAGFGESLLNILTKGGYQTVLVKNGVEGMKIIYDTLPHLVLLDITIPGADGYDILAQKQAEPMLAKIPVFFMSTQGVPINMRRIPDGSVAEFIVALHGDAGYVMEHVDRYFGHVREKPKTIESDSANSKKVLWIEDDKLIGSILEKKFISYGYDLIHTKGADEALDILKHTIPDIIVLDLLLPGMNGFDFLQRIKSDAMVKKVPVLVLSNLSRPSDIERAKILGAKAFLVKATVSLDQIISEVKVLCGQK